MSEQVETTWEVSTAADGIVRDAAELLRVGRPKDDSQVIVLTEKELRSIVLPYLRRVASDVAKPEPAKAKTRGETVAEKVATLVDSGAGYFGLSLDFEGDTLISYHSADTELMQDRLNKARRIVSRVIDAERADAEKAEREWLIGLLWEQVPNQLSSVTADTVRELERIILARGNQRPSPPSSSSAG